MNIGFEVESDIIKTVLKIASSTVASDGATTGLDSIYMELNPATNYSDVLIRTSDGTDYTEIVMQCLVTRVDPMITDFPRVSFRRLKKIIETMPNQTLLKITDDGGGLSIGYATGKSKPILLKNSNANKGALVTYATGIVHGKTIIISTPELTHAINYASKVYDNNPAFQMHNCCHLKTDPLGNGRDTITTVSHTNVKTCQSIVEFQPGSALNIDLLLNIDKTSKILPNFTPFDNVLINYDKKFICIEGDTLKNNPDSILPGISSITSFKHYHRFNAGVFPSILETSLYGNIPPASSEIVIMESALVTMLKRISAITEVTAITGFEMIMYDDTVNMKYESIYGDLDYTGLTLNTPANQRVIAKLSQVHLAKLLSLISKDCNVCISSINMGGGDVIVFHEEKDDKNYFTLNSMMQAGTKQNLLQIIDSYKQNMAVIEKEDDSIEAAQEIAVTTEDEPEMEEKIQSGFLNDMLDDLAGEE